MSVFECKHCAYPLGLCSEIELLIAGVGFIEKISMKCPQCRRMNKWRPAPRIVLRKPENRVIHCAV